MTSHENSYQESNDDFSISGFTDSSFFDNIELYLSPSVISDESSSVKFQNLFHDVDDIWNIDEINRVDKTKQSNVFIDSRNTEEVKIFHGHFVFHCFIDTIHLQLFITEFHCYTKGLHERNPSYINQDPLPLINTSFGYQSIQGMEDCFTNTHLPSIRVIQNHRDHFNLLKAEIGPISFVGCFTTNGEMEARFELHRIQISEKLLIAPERFGQALYSSVHEVLGELVYDFNAHCRLHSCRLAWGQSF